MSNRSKISNNSYERAFPSPKLSSRLTRNKIKDTDVNSKAKNVLKERGNYKKTAKSCHGKEHPQSCGTGGIQSSMGASDPINVPHEKIIPSKALLTPDNVNTSNQSYRHSDYSTTSNKNTTKKICEQDLDLGLFSIIDPEKDQPVEVNVATDQERPSSTKKDPNLSSGKGANSDTDDEQDSDLSSLGLLSQDNFLDSSQDGGYYCEVRWACHSPETIRRLKKLRGQYSIESVKEIVANFNDAHVKPKGPSYSFGTYLPKNELIDAQEMKIQKAKERAAKKRPKRFQSRKAVQEMIDMLHERAFKQRGEMEKMPSNSSSVTSCESKSTGTCDKGNVEIVTNSSSNSDLKTTDETSAKSSLGCDVDDDNCWSDEDLFKDNSFLIEATQNPEKFLNTSHDLAVVTRKSSETGTKELVGKSLSTASPVLDDSGIVASSYSSKQTFLKSTANLSSGNAKYPSYSTSSNTKPFSKPFTFVKTNSYNSNWNASTSAKTAPNSSSVIKILPSANNSVKPVQSYFKSTNSGKPSQSNFHSSRDSSLQASKNFGAKSSNAFSLKCAASVNKFVNQGNDPGNVKYGQSFGEKSVPGAPAMKPSFRKYNSFQTDNNSECKRESPSSGLNSSFKRTLSFDSVNSPNRYVAPNSGVISASSNNFAVSNQAHFGSVKSTSHPYPNAVVKSGLGQKCQSSFNQQKPKPWASARNNKQQSNLNSKAPTNKVRQEDNIASNSHTEGFDVSLPEDVLLQLLEPDDVLDSQAVIISSASTKASHRQVPPGNCHFTASKKTAQSATVFSCQGFKNEFSNTSDESKKEGGGTLVSSVRPIPLMKGTDALLSPVKPVMGDQMDLHSTVNLATHNFYKKTFSLQKVGSPHPLRALKHRQSFGPSSSTPVKHAKSNDSMGQVLAAPEEITKSESCSDSFLENAFDDSFMNDAALFESQILPMLEKAESEALRTTTPAAAAPVVGSPVKCSQEEIEKKRQAALQRRSLRLSEMKKN